MKLSTLLAKFTLPFLGLMCASAVSAQMTINGAGATFPYPIYSKWFDEDAKLHPIVRFNYQSIGSGAGEKHITSQMCDFGASKSPMIHDSRYTAPGRTLEIRTISRLDV